MEKPADKEDENKEAKLPEPLASERKSLTDEEAGKKVEEGEK